MIVLLTIKISIGGDYDIPELCRIYIMIKGSTFMINVNSAWNEWQNLERFGD